ncbi:MAG: hypothetical protein R3C56_29800 [Pirellulaceae bacterium]
MNGSECDPLTQRREVQCELPDSRLLLDKITNDRLSRALDEANQKRTCDRKDLERILLKYLGNASVGGIEIPIGPHEFEINRGKAKYIREGIRRQSICSLGIKKRESIFKDLTVRESAATFVSLGTSAMAILPSAPINSHASSPKDTTTWKSTAAREAYALHCVGEKKLSWEERAWSQRG